MSPRSKVPASSKKVESDDVDIRLPPINVMEQPLYETPGYQPPFQQGQLQNVYNDGQSRHGPFIPASDISLSSSSSASTRRLGVPSIRDILNEEAPTPEWNPILFASISALPTSRQRSGNIESNSSAVEQTNAEYGLGEDSSSLPVPSFTSTVSERESGNIPPTSTVPGQISLRDRERMKLVILQQPKAARACGLGERDRRVIDPPPILRLSLDNYDPFSQADRNLLRSPFNVTSCHLISASNESTQQHGQDVSAVNDPTDPKKKLRRLMGQLIVNPFITEDLHSEDGNTPEEARIGSYYIFSDLSCRQGGRYKLRFVLMPVDLATIPVGGRAETAHVVESDEFTVHSAKDFPGMLPSSELTKRLKSLGAMVPIKKGNESRKKVGNKKRSSDNSDGSGDET